MATDPNQVELWTIGHSTRTLEQLVQLLRAHGIEQVVDVRTMPRSRHNPQFNKDELGPALRRRRINYRHMKSLGGLRRPSKDSPNTGWRHAGFRGYADYMMTPEFPVALEQLLKIAARRRTVILCAEALPWRCHRSVLSDAAIVRGVTVRHITGPGKPGVHKLNPMARVEGTRITYPPTDAGTGMAKAG